MCFRALHRISRPPTNQPPARTFLFPHQANENPDASQSISTTGTSENLPKNHPTDVEAVRRAASTSTNSQRTKRTERATKSPVADSAVKWVKVRTGRREAKRSTPDVDTRTAEQAERSPMVRSGRAIVWRRLANHRPADRRDRRSLRERFPLDRMAMGRVRFRGVLVGEMGVFD